MSLFRAIIFSLIISIGIVAAGTALAADLTVKVDKTNNFAVVTNKLTTNITLLYLIDEAQIRRLPMFGKIGPSKSIEIPLRFTMPQNVAYAVCEIADPPKGYEKESDNYYHLSVQIL